MNPLTLKEAFDIITQVTGEVSANRATHFRIQEALKVIEAQLFKKEEDKKEIK